MYNPYPASYNSPFNQNFQQPQPQQNNSSNMIWVQGESGAKAFPVGPGASQALFDSEAQIFYIKSVDQSGMPQPLRIFSYSECNEADMRQNDIDTSMFITRDEFDDAIERLNKAIKQKPIQNNNERRSNNNGKSLIPRTNEQ